MARACLAISTAALQRDVEREGAANPQVALLQLRHELAAERAGQRTRSADDRDGRRRARVSPAVAQADVRAAAGSAIFRQRTRKLSADRLEVLEEQQAQHRGQRQRQQQGAAQGEGVGLGHRAEELPLRARSW